ncbi:MAG: hypothetical protein IT395_01625 [Candidatus Omnitrophica bacterium]|nr:hypothetical protein [Candidatus Omnitrophota bacterium]
MLRLRNAFIATAFLLWILPLGVFIKPNDEKKVCGGQRAICLCSHLARSQGSGSKKFVFAHPPGNEKEASPSGNSGHFFAADLRDPSPLLGTNFSHHTPSIYSLTVYKSIEHVPKV